LGCSKRIETENERRMEGDSEKELDSNQEPGNQQMRLEPHMCSASSISEIQGI